LSIRRIVENAPVIRVLAFRDLKARYKQSLLGPIWILFQPVAMLGAFVVGFHGVAKVGTGRVPYAIFALAGVTLWSYFQAAMMAGTSSIIGNGALVRKTACPRFAFPIAAMVAVLPSFLVPLVATLVAASADGLVSARLLVAPVAVFWLFAMTAGLVAITSSVSVRYRDIASALPFLLQVGAFVVPVGYPASTLSPTLRVVFSLNPVTGVLEAWRWAVLGVGHVYVPAIYVSLGVGALVIALGWQVFGRFEVNMADVI
jgi:lipopolysaccharide transport system permease protein